MKQTTETKPEKVKFKQLSIPLKIGIVGGFTFATIWITLYFLGTIIGLIIGKTP